VKPNMPAEDLKMALFIENGVKKANAARLIRK
jgi:hypothetical protein